MNRFYGEEVDWVKQYSSVGEYVVEFEFIVNLIRFQCSSILQSRGLKDWALSEIIFGQRQFTADPLVSCFQSLCSELLKNQKGKEEIIKRVSSFKSRFDKQIEFRNDLLHSFHLYGKNFVEVTDQDKPHELAIIKNSPRKSGHRIKEVAKAIGHVQKNIAELRSIKNDFLTLTSSLTLFVINNDLLVNFKKTEG